MKDVVCVVEKSLLLFSKAKQKSQNLEEKLKEKFSSTC